VNKGHLSRLWGRSRKGLIQSALAVFFNLSGETRTTLHPEWENVDKFWRKGAKDLNSRELGYAAKSNGRCVRINPKRPRFRRRAALRLGPAQVLHPWERGRNISLPS